VDELGCDDRRVYIILLRDYFMKKKDSIVIPRKAIGGIAAGIAIIAVLLSKDKAPEVLLFGIGIFVGAMIARGYFVK